MKKMCSILIALAMVVIFPMSSMAASGFSESAYDYRTLEAMAYDDYEVVMENKVPFDAVIVVNSNSLDSDGLSASSLIRATNGQICAINNNSYDDRLDKMVSHSTTKDIYFIGGSQVIPESLKNKFKSKGYNCITLAGKNRIETSYRVAEQVKKINGNIDEIAITSAYKGVPDSVSMSFVGYMREMPVILTNGKSIPFNTNGVKTYAIGGSAVISDSLVKKTNATRLGGKDRYETNQKILKYFKYNGNAYTLCYGDSKGSNMKVASLAGCLRYGYPLVLVSNNSNKDILEGAKEFEYVTVNNPVSDRLKNACFNARFGRSVTNAANTLYKVTKSNPNDIYFKYHEGNDSYVSSSPNYSQYRKQYHIFDVVSSDGDYADFNMLVNKTTNKVYEWAPGATKPIPFK